MGGEAGEQGDPFGFVAGCKGAGGLGHGDGGLVVSGSLVSSSAAAVYGTARAVSEGLY